MAIEWDVCADIHGELPTRSMDARIGAVAARQHGVVSRAQLRGLGLGRGAIDHRLAVRRLHPVHRGVFAVGYATLSRHGRWMAAVLAAGPGAVLSHRSAAALWGIRDSGGADVDVVAAAQRKRAGIRTHRIVLPADEVTVERGIPVTTPARTLLDLAETLTPQQLERAMHEAEYRRLASPVSLDAHLTRHPNRRGSRALKQILATQHLGDTITKSEFEAAFLTFLEARKLPRPQTNRRIGDAEVDAVWPAQRLIVELDSRQAHATTRGFESDRARDRELMTRGYRVARITWRQLHDDPTTIARQIRALLT